MRRVLALGLAVCAAGCTLIATFDDLPPDPAVVSGDDAGSTKPRDSGKPTTSQDDGATTEPTPTPTGPRCGENDVGALLLKDDLRQEKSFFAPAAGFNTGWRYEMGYLQPRLVLEPDAALFTKDATIREADVSFKAASTDIDNNLTPIQRLILVLVGAKGEGASFSAIGCGLVYDPERDARAAIVELKGAPPNVEQTILGALPVNGVNEGQDFDIRAELRDGALACSVRTTGLAFPFPVALPLPTPLVGSIGFYTRQTQARFRDGTICKLK